MNDSRRTRVQLTLWLLCWSWIGLATTIAVFADVPIEEFSLATGEEHDDLFQRTIAILSLTIPICEETNGRETPAADDRRRALACVGVAALTLAGDRQGETSATRLPVADTQPFSGWRFNFVRVVRYPVVSISEETLEIVVDPGQLSTVRFDLASWRKLPRHDYLEDGFELLRVDRDGTLPRYEEVAISFLSPEPRVQFYERPSLEAPSFEAHDETLLPGTQETFGDHSGRLAIQEVHDGFARVVVVDPCGEIEGSLPTVGWLRLRDESGRLRVWPQVGLSC